MSVISIRIEDDLQDQLEKFAKKQNNNVAASARKLIADGLAVDAYKKQNNETVSSELLNKTASSELLSEKQKLDAKYKRNFEFMVLEVSALLRLIVKESGKFTHDEAIKLLSKAQSQVETYMRHYESGGKK